MTATQNATWFDLTDAQQTEILALDSLPARKTGRVRITALLSALWTDMGDCWRMTFPAMPRLALPEWSRDIPKTYAQIVAQQTAQGLQEEAEYDTWLDS